MRSILIILLTLTMVTEGVSQTNTLTFQIEGQQFQYEELNQVDQPTALLVLFDGGSGKASNIPPETSLPDSAVGYKFKTIGIDQSEFFLSDSTYHRIQKIIEHVMHKEGIDHNLFLGGFSLGGFTAIRFSEMAVEKNETTMIPNAVFAVDPPLDHLDFVDYCLRELNRPCANDNMTQLGKNEAKWVLNYYLQHFGDYKEESSAYIANSCFTASLEDGGNGRYLSTVPVNLIHEIDIMWLITERCRDLSDTNALVGSKFINFLIRQGNKDAIITNTTNKGYRADGRRHPHSWSIAEPKPTLDWISKYLDEAN